MELSEQFILLQAPNPAAADHGRKLSRGGKFSNLCRSADGTLVWGECAGSGKMPYRVSVDWTDAQAPVCRCSCPSRQFPCKHGLALMYEIMKQKPFAPCEIPEDILKKREKKQSREEKKLSRRRRGPPKLSPRSTNQPAPKNSKNSWKGWISCRNWCRICSKPD